MHRAEDMIVPVEHGRYLAAHIPGAKYVELPGWRAIVVRGRLGSDPGGGRGVRHRRAPDPRDRIAQLLTVLFTDIVDSTRLAA